MGQDAIPEKLLYAAVKIHAEKDNAMQENNGSSGNPRSP